MAIAPNTYEVISLPYEVKIYDASGSGKPVRIETYVRVRYFK